MTERQTLTELAKAAFVIVLILVAMAAAVGVTVIFLDGLAP